MHKRNQRRPIKALSVFMAAALVFTSFPSEAKTGKKERSNTNPAHVTV